MLQGKPTPPSEPESVPSGAASLLFLLSIAVGAIGVLGSIWLDDWRWAATGGVLVVLLLISAGLTQSTANRRPRG